MRDKRGILSVMTTIAWLVRNVHWRRAPWRGPGIWADWRKRVTYLAQSRSFWSNQRQSGLIWTNLANRLEIVPARAPFGKGVKKHAGKPIKSCVFQFCFKDRMGGYMKHPSKQSPNQTNQVQTGWIWIAKTVRMKQTTPHNPATSECYCQGSGYLFH